jgi:glycerol uptake facilitator protein
MTETPRTVRAVTAAPSLLRRCVAEAIGTGILVAFGAGAIMAALVAGDGEIAYGGLGFIALAHALAIALAIYGIGGISGGHINPAVTFGLAVVRRLPWPEVPAYWVAQLVGGALGGFAVLLAVGAGAVDLGGVGSPAVAEGVRFGQAGVAEAIGHHRGRALDVPADDARVDVITTTGSERNDDTNRFTFEEGLLAES